MVRSSVNDSSKSDKYMMLTITDFGPISNGTITIKPLTILLGPNGCGKSHVATLAYTIVKAESIRLHGIADHEQKPSDILHKQSQHILKQYTADLDHILDPDTFKIFVQQTVCHNSSSNAMKNGSGVRICLGIGRIVPLRTKIDTLLPVLLVLTVKFPTILPGFSADKYR